MPILSRRSQSQYCRRQTGSGQLLNGERRKRNAVHHTKSAMDNYNVSRITSLYRKGTGTAESTLDHSCMQLEDVHSATILPDVNCNVNGSGSGSLCPVPPPLPPSLSHYCRPAVGRQRRVPADDLAREREALKRQQRLQVVVKMLLSVIAVSFL